MSNDDQKKRRYSDEEFALILRKASEIQSSDGGPVGDVGEGSGLTLDEIRSIAKEAGIDPGAVTRAASILGALAWEGKAGLAVKIFGGPEKFHLDCEIPGRLPPEEMGRILEEIRRAAEHQGEASEVFGGVEWNTVGELSGITVNISPRDDSTSIQIVGNRGPAAGVTFIFPIAASAILVGALGATFEPTTAVGIISLVGGTVGSGFLLARTLWASGTKKFRKRLTHLMGAVSRSVGQAALPPGADEEGG